MAYMAQWFEWFGIKWFGGFFIFGLRIPKEYGPNHITINSEKEKI